VYLPTRNRNRYNNNKIITMATLPAASPKGGGSQQCNKIAKRKIGMIQKLSYMTGLTDDMIQAAPNINMGSLYNHKWLGKSITRLSYFKRLDVNIKICTLLLYYQN